MRAESAKIPNYVCCKKEFPSVEARDREILRLLKEYDVDYVILAGYLGILSKFIIDEYPNRIVNIHPSLLPKFGGKNFYGIKVHAAVIAAGEKESGATAHFVGTEIDGGPIIRQQKLTVYKGDTPEALQKRIESWEQAAERWEQSETVAKLRADLAAWKARREQAREGFRQRMTLDKRLLLRNNPTARSKRYGEQLRFLRQRMYEEYLERKKKH